MEVPDDVAAVLEEERRIENRQHHKKSYYHVYLAEDTRYEIVMTSHGYTVLEWESVANTWAGEELCATPEIMRDVYPSIQKFCADAGYRGTFVSDAKMQILNRL